jgi:hypothetical protein
LGLRISEGGPTVPPAPPQYDFNVDNKWMVYPVAGRDLIMSNGPGSNEDAPTLTTEITVAHAGKYEVIFHFMDSVDNPDEGWIYAKLNDQEAEEYGAMHWASVRATGGTTPPYPWIDGSTVSGMFWYTAVMGEVDLAAGESITITVDDVQGSSFSEFMASVFEGVTLRVLEGGPPIEEIQVSPVFRYEWKVDANGNRFTTVAQDESLQFNDVFTDTASYSDNLWRYRPLGIYGAVYESGGPRGTEDCPALKTSVEVAQGGTYEVFLLFGDVSAVGTDDEAHPTPIKAAIEGNEMQAYFQWDAEFIGLWGFNMMETSIGKVTVGDGETVTVFIDDHEEVEGNDRRSVYAGLRIAKSTTPVSDWELF